MESYSICFFHLFVKHNQNLIRMKLSYLPLVISHLFSAVHSADFILLNQWGRLYTLYRWGNQGFTRRNILLQVTYPITVGPIQFYLAHSLQHVRMSSEIFNFFSRGVQTSTYLKQVRVLLFLHLTFNVTCIAPLLNKPLYSKPYLKVLL